MRLSLALTLSLLSTGFASPSRLPRGAGDTTITTDPAAINGQTFDYVIAGAGVAGLTVANHLAKEGHTVAVIEAGPDYGLHPDLVDAGKRVANCNWKYKTSDESGNDLPWPAEGGKCVGGGSSINGAMWYHPSNVEFDAIAALGNPGWNAIYMKNYLKKIEKATAPTSAQAAQGATMDTSLHGTNGFLDVGFPTPLRIPKAVALYKQASEEVFGITPGTDLSNRGYQGITANSIWTLKYDSASGINKRSSAATSLLYPANQQRPTQTVLTEHLVSSVIFNANNRATGLNFVPATSNGQAYTVNARREVILSAGALASAPILERSGVGASEVLSAAKVPLRVNLPGVGRHLQDQPGVGLSGSVNAANVSDTQLQDGRNIFAPIISLPDVYQLFNIVDAVSLLLEFSLKIDEWAAAEVASGASATLSGAKKLLSQLRNNFFLRSSIGEWIGESYPYVMTSIFWPSTPLSKGHIHIKSSDVYQQATITPRFWTNPLDRKIGVQLAKKARAVLAADAFKYTVNNPAADGPAAGATDAQWANWLVGSTYGASHWVGSTSMMPRDDGGVVSPTLNVYGTTCLRVVDAGIFPLQLTSHTMTGVYPAAMKAVDMILANGCK